MAIEVEAVEAWACAGEFRVKGVGQLRAYLPAVPGEPGRPNLQADQASYSSVHPETRAEVALVTGLDMEAPVWKLCPEGWSSDARDEAIEKTRQLQRHEARRL